MNNFVIYFFNANLRIKFINETISANDISKKIPIHTYDGTNGDSL